MIKRKVKFFDTIDFWLCFCNDVSVMTRNLRGDLVMLERERFLLKEMMCCRRSPRKSTTKTEEDSSRNQQQKQFWQSSVDRSGRPMTCTTCTSVGGRPDRSTAGAWLTRPNSRVGSVDRPGRPTGSSKSRAKSVDRPGRPTRRNQVSQWVSVDRSGRPIVGFGQKSAAPQFAEQRV